MKAFIMMKPIASSSSLCELSFTSSDHFHLAESASLQQSTVNTHLSVDLGVLTLYHFSRHN